MRKFIIKIATFILPPVLAYLGIGTFLKFELRNDIKKHQIFILGDSQTEFIRMPEVYNRSIHGSPYYVHYEFAKEFISTLQGKKVYIACNYQNLSDLYQNRLANDSLMPGWRASTFQALDKFNLFNHKYSEIRPKDLSYSFFDIKKVPKLFCELYISTPNENTLVSVVKDTLSIQGAIQRHWNHSKYILKDTIQRNYLNKLILLLKENNCEVVLLKMPLTNFYINNVPKAIINELTLLPNKYKIRLLDLNTDLNISNNYSLFKDYGHLNSRGDSLITNYFENYEIKQSNNK